MKKKLAVTSSLLLSILLNGCATDLYKYYEYEVAEIPVLGSKVMIATVGSYSKMSSGPDVWKYADPYFVHVYFLTDNEPGEAVTIEIEDISATYKGQITRNAEEQQTKKILLPQMQSLTKDIPRTEYGVGQTVSVNEVYSNHKIISLSIKLTYQDRTEVVQAELQPLFDEMYRGGVKDVLGGV